MPPIDNAKVEKAMSMLAKEAGNINEDDPRKAANLMRKLSDATGLKMGAKRGVQDRSPLSASRLGLSKAGWHQVVSNFSSPRRYLKKQFLSF